MNKLDDIVTDLSARAYCLGQDYKKGDGSTSKVDVASDKAKEQIKEFMLELIGEDDYNGMAQVDSKFWAHAGRNDLRAELRQKVEEL